MLMLAVADRPAVSRAVTWSVRIKSADAVLTLVLNFALQPTVTDQVWEAVPELPL